MTEPRWDSYESYLAEKERAWTLLLKQFREDDPDLKMTPDQIKDYAKQFLEDWFSK